MARSKAAKPKGSGGGSVRVRLELDLDPGVLSLEGTLSRLSVNRADGGLDLRGRLGEIAIEDLVARFRSRPGRQSRRGPYFAAWTDSGPTNTVIPPSTWRPRPRSESSQ